MAGRESALRGNRARHAHFVGCVGALFPSVPTGVGGVSIGRSGYRKRLICTESRYLETHIQGAIRVNAARAGSKEVRAVCPHGDSHEAPEGDHGTGEDT